MNAPAHRSWVVLAVALAVGAAAAVGLYRYVQRHVDDIEARERDRPTVGVIVPKEDLPVGARLGSDNVAVRNVPSEWAHSAAIRATDFARVEGQRLATPALRGEMIVYAQLDSHRASSFSSRLVAGHRAITVPVDEINSISGLLEPGDRIDLVVSVRKDTRVFMVPLLQSVNVLATGTRAAVEGESKDGKATYTTITLDATPEEAQRVLAAREVGKVAALLRAPGDTAFLPRVRREATSLLGLPDDRLFADGVVPVIYGGQPLRGVARLARDRASPPTLVGAPALSAAVAPIEP